MSLQSALLRCPGCGTVFRGPATLPAHGRVRCGVCSEVFAAQADVDPQPSGVPAMRRIFHARPMCLRPRRRHRARACCAPAWWWFCW